MSVGFAQSRIVSFQQDIALEMLCKLTRLGEPLIIARARHTHQPVKLLGMGCHDDARRQLLHPCLMIGQHVQSVSIHHDRALRAAYLSDQRDGRILALSQSRANGEGVEVLALHAVREIGFLAVHLKDCLRHGHLHDAIVALGGVHGHLTGSGAQTGTRSKDGSSCHAVTASNDQCMTHRAFVGKVAPMAQTRDQVCLFLNAAPYLCFLDIVGAQTDVQHPQPSQILLAVGQHHAELLLLQRKRQIRTDNILPDVISIVLAHQSRRHVDTDHLGRTLIDVFHQGGKATAEGFVESRAEESVHNQRVGGQLRRIEVHSNFCKMVDFFGIYQSLLIGGAVF